MTAKIMVSCTAAALVLFQVPAAVASDNTDSRQATNKIAMNAAQIESRYCTQRYEGGAVRLGSLQDPQKAMECDTVTTLVDACVAMATRAAGWLQTDQAGQTTASRIFTSLSNGSSGDLHPSGAMAAWDSMVHAANGTTPARLAAADFNACMERVRLPEQHRPQDTARVSSQRPISMPRFQFTIGTFAHRPGGDNP